MKSKKYIVVMDVGTFCDHRLMDNAIVDLRKKYNIIYITDKNHKLPETDIKKNYKFPEFMLHYDDIVVQLTSSIVNQIIYIAFNPIKFVKIVNFVLKISKMLSSVIDYYSPVGILAHYGNLQHILAAGRFYDVPTTILHFAPGFLPNKNVPFPFNEKLINNP